MPRSPKNTTPATPAREIETMIADLKKKKTPTARQKALRGILKAGATAAGAAAIAVMLRRRPELRKTVADAIAAAPKSLRAAAGKVSSMIFATAPPAKNAEKPVVVAAKSKSKTRAAAEWVLWYVTNPHQWLGFQPFHIVARGGRKVLSIVNPKTGKDIGLSGKEVRELIESLPPDVARELLEELKNLDGKKSLHVRR